MTKQAKSIHILLSDAEHRAVKTAAASRGLPLIAVGRRLLLRWARAADADASAMLGDDTGAGSSPNSAITE